MRILEFHFIELPVVQIPKIKAAILDVDGVIIGERKGVNSPDPHPLVLEKLKQLQSCGISIILCTAKPYYSIQSIIQGANLNNPHICDGGGLLINPCEDRILECNSLSQEESSRVVTWLLENKFYTEVYGINDYFIQSNQTCEITDKHTHVLQQPPQQVNSLLEYVCSGEPIVKIMAVVEDENSKYTLQRLFSERGFDLVLSWGVHPIVLPLQFGIITQKGISKEHGAKRIIEELSLSFADTLGVGDSTSDWQFINLCRYGAAMGNGSNELKELVQSKGEGFYYVGPSVDENGIINILDHFVWRESDTV